MKKKTVRAKTSKSAPLKSAKTVRPAKVSRSSQKQSDNMKTMLFGLVLIIFTAFFFGLWRMNQMQSTDTQAEAAPVTPISVSATRFAVHPSYTWWYRSTVNIVQPAQNKPTISSFFIVLKIKDWGMDTYGADSVAVVQRETPGYVFLTQLRPNVVLIPSALADKLIIDRADIVKALNGDGVRVVIKARFKTKELAEQNSSLLSNGFLKLNTITRLKETAVPKVDDLRYTVWGYQPGSSTETVLVDMPRRADRPQTSASYSQFNLSETELAQ